LRQFDAAIESYKQALKTKPDYAEVYNNMGNVLRDEGNLDAAIESYKKALKIKPGYAESYYNMGLTLKDKGEVDEAIDSYKQALKIKPYYAEAYYNMGIALNEMGNSEAAIDSYTQALKIKPDCIEYAVNLIETLTSYIPVREGLSHPIISTNREIRKIDPGHDFAEIISDDFIFSLYSDYVKIISAHKLEINYPLSQIYRRNSIGRNCERHMDIFSNHNIIPKFCFGCYKVQIEPRTVIELIRLFLLFDDLDLENNNTRKCLIELRPEISGFYKGLIYCSNLNEANQIVEKLDGILGKKLGPGLFAKIKRGCSEYPLSFPQYKVINNLGNHMMGYNPDWISVEEKYDTDHPINTTLKRIPSLNGLSLSDFLVIQNWLAYARGIGDKSADLITESPVFPMDILNMATARAEIHNFVN
jgi:cytochrome c-type biogenesis protein CcmH/NrfG